MPTRKPKDTKDKILKSIARLWITPYNELLDPEKVGPIVKRARKIMGIKGTTLYGEGQ